MSTRITTTPSRPSEHRLPWKAAARVVLGAMVVTFVLNVIAGGDGRTPLGGDFPAFYGAGTIVNDGNWDDLYDPDTQAEAQADLWADFGESYLYFAYPPFVAATYAPLAALPYKAAYSIHSAAMLAATVGALWLLRPVSELVRRHFELTCTAALLSYPVFRAITGGQNTGVTILLVALFWRGHHDRNDVMIGASLALLAFKPQLAVPLIGLTLLARRHRAVGVAAAGIAGLWVIGAATMGVGWLSTWWSEASDFASIDADVNKHNAVSFLGFAEAILGAGSTGARAIAAPFVLAGIAGLMWLWLRRPAIALDVRMATTVVGIILISPHAMFYDAGLLVLVGIVAIDRFGDRAIPAAGAILGLTWVQVAGESIGIAPLFFLVVAIAVWCVTRLLPAADEAPG